MPPNRVMLPNSVQGAVLVARPALTIVLSETVAYGSGFVVPLTLAKSVDAATGSTVQ